jgi:protein SCO1/2
MFHFLRMPLNAVIKQAMMGLMALSIMFLAGCSDPNQKWSLYDVSGHLPDLRFSLVGEGNKTITQQDLKDKTVLMFFGYASCPDICPTTMAQLTEVLEKLGDDAKDVRIIFVSVDPHRDKPDVLQAYVNAFNKNAIGLTGNEKQIADLARRYRVAYQIEKPKPGDDAKIYDVTHSRGVFIFDKTGRARLLAPDTEKVEVVTQDLRQLIDLTRAGKS